VQAELLYSPLGVSYFDTQISPFRIAVINDEITQDFGRACEIASQEFGMEWIELRGMWNKNLLNLDAKEVAEARRILEKNKLRVTDIASPLFKVDWPDAPKRDALLLTVSDVRHVRGNRGAISNVHAGIRCLMAAHAVDPVGHVVLVFRGMSCRAATAHSSY
jgi:hypothetical protein